jgi:hypothetical protein
MNLSQPTALKLAKAYLGGIAAGASIGGGGTVLYNAILPGTDFNTVNNAVIGAGLGAATIRGLHSYYNKLITPTENEFYDPILNRRMRINNLVGDP